MTKDAALHTLCMGSGSFRGIQMIFRIMAGLAALALPFSAMAQEKVLKAVMHADVRVIDPIWTTQTIANIHGALVYDTLFGNDANQKPQPQMVGKRSEEHTSELQSRGLISYAVFCLKKKTHRNYTIARAVWDTRRSPHTPSALP